MKLVLISFFFLLTLHVIYSQNIYEFKKNTTPKECIIRMFDAKDNLGIVEIGKKITKDNSHMVVLEFNQKKMITKETKKDTSYNIYSIKVTKYDSRDYPISIDKYFYSYDEKKDTHKYRIVNRYNDEGLKLVSNDYDLESSEIIGKTIWSYNYLNRLEAILHYDSEEKLISKEVVTNHEDGKIKRIESADISNIENNTGFSEEYDNKGRLIESFSHGYGHTSYYELFYDINDKLIQKNGKSDGSDADKIYYKYNIYNDLIEMKIEYDENYIYNRGGRNIITYEYIYDLKGNWIQMIEFDNYSPKRIVQRKFEYF
jgi:hypothetical protein